MRNRSKHTMKVTDQNGFQMKVWFNTKTGKAFPTNWKIQAGFLNAPMIVKQEKPNAR